MFLLPRNVNQTSPGAGFRLHAEPDRVSLHYVVCISIYGTVQNLSLTAYTGGKPLARGVRGILCPLVMANSLLTANH